MLFHQEGIEIKKAFNRRPLVLGNYFQKPIDKVVLCTSPSNPRLDKE